MLATGLLGESALAKAERYMRALRRATLAYWYATIEASTPRLSRPRTPALL